MGRGVAFASGAMELSCSCNGVMSMLLGRPEASESGGEGGVSTSAVVDVSELAGGGVEMVGEDTVVMDFSERGDLDRLMFITKFDFRSRCRRAENSARRSFSCLISASILKSESSSRNLCVSILKLSLSCSLVFNSSSNMTPLSIATLYFDSRSSSDDVVCRACRS